MNRLVILLSILLTGCHRQPTPFESAEEISRHAANLYRMGFSNIVVGSNFAVSARCGSDALYGVYIGDLAAGATTNIFVPIRP